MSDITPNVNDEMLALQARIAELSADLYRAKSDYTEAQNRATDQRNDWVRFCGVLLDWIKTNDLEEEYHGLVDDYHGGFRRLRLPALTKRYTVTLDVSFDITLEVATDDSHVQDAVLEIMGSLDAPIDYDMSDVVWRIGQIQEA